MRKVLLIAVFAASLTPMGDANSVNRAEDFSIRYPVPVYPVPGNLESPGIIGSACFYQTPPFSQPYYCQKSTWAKVARCAYLTDKPKAQGGRQGTVGYLARIDATAVRGVLGDDRDNNTFDLLVQNKHISQAGGTLASLPDVDISFLRDLGDCVADVETPAGPIGTGGKNPTQLMGSLIARTSYNTYGDELNAVFPSGRYLNPLNETQILTANTYWAVITITYGTNVNQAEMAANTSIRFRCRDQIAVTGAGFSNPRSCGIGWFIQV